MDIACSYVCCAAGRSLVGASNRVHQTCILKRAYATGLRRRFKVHPEGAGMSAMTCTAILVERWLKQEFSYRDWYISFA
jgi:hypothetical protein